MYLRINWRISLIAVFVTVLGAAFCAGVYAAANSNRVKSRTISAENQFTDPIKVSGPYNVVVMSSDGETWSATVQLKCKLEGMPDYALVASYTANAFEKGADLGEDGAQCIIGVPTGSYSSGAPYVRISQREGK